MFALELIIINQRRHVNKMQNGLGLWLPVSSYPTKIAMKGSMEFIGVAISYRQVYGLNPTWDDVRDVLAPYSLERIVDTICRINACLHSKTFPWDRDSQQQICFGLFGPEEGKLVLKAVARETKVMKESEGAPPVLLFHEQQALNLVKASFLIKTLKEVDSSLPPVGIGKALLMISDLIDGEPGDLESIEPGQSDYLERWLRYILANELFSNPTIGKYALARCHDLYLTEKPVLKNCGSYVDLHALLESITGIEAELLWSTIFALASHWATIKPEAISQGVMAINRNGYFKDFLFTAEEVNSFLKICAADAGSLKKQIENRFTLGSLRPFDVLPLARYPIVNFQGRLYATSATLLMQKLTTGLHHIYLDDTNINPKPQRQRYLTYMGEVFGDYVHRILDRMFPPITGRYLRLDDLRPDMTGKYCDALLVYEDSVVLIEAKASLFPLEARAGYDITATRGRFQDIYEDGAAQLQSTIDALRNGLRDHKNVIPKVINRYYPVIITLENIPMNPIFYGEIRRMLESQGLLTGNEIKPLQSADIGEFERIEAVVSRGASLKDLLDKKLSNSADTVDAWRNYLYRRVPALKPETNDYLEERAKSLIESAKKLFTERSR